GSKTGSDFHWQKRINIGFSNDASGHANFTGWIDEVVIWNEELDTTQIAALATGLARPGVTSGYSRYIQTPLESELFRKGTSVYIRLPFHAEQPFTADILRLNLRYDDGFVSWLNGQEVARSNLIGEVAWNSRANVDRIPKDAARLATYDLSSMKSLLHDGTNILAIQVLNEKPESQDFLIAAELEQLSKSPGRYMLTPSPAKMNGTGVVGFVKNVKFGLDAGLFEKPTQVPLSCDTPGATIIYTTDGSLPTIENGTKISPSAQMLPTSGMVAIDNTTILRAAAFKEFWQPSRISTRTFIFPSKVIRQASVQPGIQGWSDWGMDVRVVDNPQPGYEAESALYALPSISIVAPVEDIFGENGIYTRSSSRGAAWERAASVELIFPDGRKGFQEDAGIQMHGNSSRNHSFTPKNPMRVEFKAKYGDTKLRYKLFEDSPRDTFDHFLLRPCSTDSWPVRPGNSVLGVQRWHPDHGTYMRDQYMRNVQREMGFYAPYGRYVHLYLDGLYWGIYNLSERGGQHTNASYHGGSKEDWDIIKDFAELESGSKDSWNELISLANADLSNEANYQRLQGNKPDGSPDPAQEDFLDVDNLIDYMIQHIHGGAEDWPDHNYWAARRKGPNSTGFHFITWDQEISNDSLVRTHTRVPNRFEDPINRHGPSYLYGKLMANETFKWTFIDRVHKHMFNDGLLTPENNRSRWSRLQSLLDKAIVAESARWGDVRRNPPYTREQDWLK
ncbi:MAG: CotH kinase family protein, partial [Opitutae bacterium]